MFRHKTKSDKKADLPTRQADVKNEEKEKKKDKTKEKPIKEEHEVEKVKGKEEIQPKKVDSIQELLEKNLKWSQIIYEQNRKINRKLTWAAIAGWLRLILILAPLVLALLYLPPILKDVWNNYSDVLGLVESSGVDKADSSKLNELIKLFNLSSSGSE